MLFATLINSIILELGGEQLEASGLEVIGLEKARCLSNKSVIYSSTVKAEPSKAS